MFKSNLMRFAATAVLSIILVTACGKDKDTAEQQALTSGDSILRFVPANTPYIFASGKPLPDDLLDKLEPKMTELMEAYQVIIREVGLDVLAKNSKSMSDEDAQHLSAVIEELLGLFSVDGMRSAGIERDSQFVLFGHGLMPVMRVEVSDAELFEKAIARVEAAAKEPLSTSEIDGHSYRYIGDDEARIIIGVFDSNAVVTFAPSSFGDEQLRTLLGLELPASSIAQSTVLQDIIAEYDFTQHYSGFIDATRIAATFLDNPTGLDAVLVESMDFDPSSISGVCKEEIRDLVAIAPRMVFGYNEITAKDMSANFVVEMRKDVASGLSKLTAPVPGLGSDPGGLVSFGMSFDLQATRDFYAARLDAMEADPFECEYFEDLQAGIEKGRDALNQPMPPVVNGLRGFNAVVDDISGFDLASKQPPEKIDASILVAIDNAEALLAMGAMFSPELASLDLQPDGTPVALPLPPMPGIPQEAFAAMHDDAIAVSLGGNAESRVSKILNADPTKPSPLFGMTMDAARYYALIADTMMLEQPDEKNQLSEPARAALRDAMISIGSMYERMAVDVLFTERGIEMKSEVSLAD